MTEIELFLNSVPLLAKLSREDKMQLVDAFTEEAFAAGSTIIREGDPGDKFYIIKRCVLACIGANTQQYRQQRWQLSLTWQRQLLVQPGALC